MENISQKKLKNFMKIIYNNSIYNDKNNARITVLLFFITSILLISNQWTITLL